MESLKIAVIGNGIFSLSFLWTLVQSEFSAKRNLEINHYYSEDWAPACTLNSTAIAALRGAEKDYSAINELLFEGWDELVRFSKFLKQKNQLDKKNGIEEALLFYDVSFVLENIHRWRQMTEVPIEMYPLEFMKNDNWRSSACFLFEPKIFQDFLMKEILTILREKNITYNVFPSTVVIANKNNELFFSGELPPKFFNDIFLFTGVYYKYFPDLQIDKVSEGKKVCGIYLEGKVFLGDQSFTLNFSQRSFTYRSLTQEVLIGTMDLLGEIERPPERYLQEWVDQTFQAFPFLNREVFHIKMGRRHQLSKRLPKYGKNKNTYYILGGHKNGFTLSFHLAKKVFELFSNEYLS